MENIRRGKWEEKLSELDTNFSKRGTTIPETMLTLWMQKLEQSTSWSQKLTIPNQNQAMPGTLKSPYEFDNRIGMKSEAKMKNNVKGLPWNKGTSNYVKSKQETSRSVNIALTN